MFNTAKIARTSVCGLVSMGCLCSTMTSCTSDATTTQVQGTAIGAVGGALLGAGIAALAGGDSKAIIASAVAGGVVGGIAGFAWGNSIVKQKEQYAQTEDYFNAHIENLGNRIQQAELSNAKLKKEIAALQSQHKKLSAAEKKKQQETMNNNLSLMDQDINAARSALNDTDISEKEATALKARIDEAEKAKNELAANVALLNMLQ